VVRRPAPYTFRTCAVARVTDPLTIAIVTVARTPDPQTFRSVLYFVFPFFPTPLFGSFHSGFVTAITRSMTPASSPLYCCPHENIRPRMVRCAHVPWSLLSWFRYLFCYFLRLRPYRLFRFLSGLPDFGFDTRGRGSSRSPFLCFSPLSDSSGSLLVLLFTSCVFST
jgi:hypothetical protein